ncbi:AAA family ATPase [Bradyrhizobium sp. th.b2]|uniref:AAA family ATPase n=1 Tax=Bradyrhizobium sp. th-b2 TaxID=172088 RepID=UPI00040C7262|nr:AAA family ATPase [Bradyrhizobium sp. th.b2]
MSAPVNINDGAHVDADSAAAEELDAGQDAAALSTSADEIEFDGDEFIPFDDIDFCRPITPKKWMDTVSAPQRWLAEGRVPSDDVTILAGDGGSGKTEIACQLLIYVAAGIDDWLGSAIENGPALFISCEEPQDNIRRRVECISKHVNIDAHGLDDLHILFPDLDDTWLVHAERDGRLSKTSLLKGVEAWIAAHRPRLVVIDSVAAVFDADAISRRQVRTFVAMLRKVARKHGVAIVLLDHPSVRGMTDGTGTANSVDWRNSVRSMMLLSEPDKEDDPDMRVLRFTKNNRGRKDQKLTLRWAGLTFTTEAEAAASPHRTARLRSVRWTSSSCGCSTSGSLKAVRCTPRAPRAARRPSLLSIRKRTA